jgi:hypothetical protein
MSVHPYGLSASPPSRPEKRLDSLADVLERVLDRGVVIAGDIVVCLVDVELLTLKVRLVIASLDTARSVGIDWWVSDPFLNSHARGLEIENRDLRSKIETMEQLLQSGDVA